MKNALKEGQLFLSLFLFLFLPKFRKAFRAYFFINKWKGRQDANERVEVDGMKIHTNIKNAPPPII
jgi:hypothetical protein